MTNQDDKNERESAAIAVGIKALRATWPAQLDVLAFKAETARARYLAARKVGFSEAQAFRLCLTDIKL